MRSLKNTIVKSYEPNRYPKSQIFKKMAFFNIIKWNDIVEYKPWHFGIVATWKSLLTFLLVSIENDRQLLPDIFGFSLYYFAFWGNVRKKWHPCCHFSSLKFFGYLWFDLFSLLPLGWIIFSEFQNSFFFHPEFK